MFPLVDTHGIPLDLVVDKLRNAGMMPDWLDFYDEAIKKGWNPERVHLRLLEAVGDVYGPTFREGWEQRFNEVLTSREST